MTPTTRTARPARQGPYEPCWITRARHGLEEARLHIVDLDNLHCGPCPSDRIIELVRSDYERIGFSSGDLLFAACNHAPGRLPCSAHRRSFHLRQSWPNCSMRLAQGPDGADLELLVDVDTFLGADDLKSRFAEVTIASGDHIFAPAARQFREAGLTVHVVVSLETNLSRELRAEADGCIWLLPAGRCIRHGQGQAD